MPVIGLVDDRAELRTTLQKIISRNLPRDWHCESVAPFENKNEYISWISENEIAALILDEKLHEQAPDSEGHVEYNGHDLTFYLREKINELPIHIVTSYDEDPNLVDNRPEFESVYNREDFIRDKERVIKQILRSAARYFDTFQSELSELGALAQKAAKKSINDDELKKLIALQTKLNISVDTESIDMAKMVTELESKLSELNDDMDKLSSFTGNEKK